MQIALALSKEEHEREEEKRKGEDVLYQVRDQRSTSRVRIVAARTLFKHRIPLVSRLWTSRHSVDPIILMRL